MSGEELKTRKEESFDPSFFQGLKEAEERYFWFTVRRRWIFDAVSRFSPPPAKLLEVGCGTGNVSSYLAQKGYDTTGCEYYEEALGMAWPGFRKVRGDVAALPFEDRSFDIVCLFDVIEHIDDDVATVREAARVLKEDGIMVITVPAGEELWSYVDVESCHRRRYSRDSLAAVLSGAGLAPLTMDYMFMALYWPMKHMRRKTRKDLNEQFRISPLLNRLLTLYFDAERNIAGFVPLPVGTSLIAVAGRRL